MRLSPDDKVRLYRELVRGADDVFALRTESVWRPVYAPLPDDYVLMHLAGRAEIGCYPLIPHAQGLPVVWWVAADFDGKRERSMWERDVQRAVSWLLDTGACVFVNLSRSAKGAHVRVLFREPVPAWMARRWMLSWLEEAGVTSQSADEDDWEPVPPSFDRLIPPQDTLVNGTNKHGKRLPGNLIGSPLNLALAKRNGGSLPLDPRKAAKGDFAPDGQHWHHVVRALEQRVWGVHELRKAMEDMPGALEAPPPPHIRTIPLSVIPADNGKLDYMLSFCAFIGHLRKGGQTYPLRVALASQLHRFGAAGREAFHAISALDSRYDVRETDRKWLDTSNMRPVRCDTLVSWGYACPHLQSARCNGAGSPAYFADVTHAEIL